jgi:DNA-binding XRE family transcriptional regulator
MATKAKPIEAVNPKALNLGRTRKEIMVSLSPADRAAVETRTAELHAEVEGLKALRHLAERSQEQIAQSLGVKQPAIVKIERQTDLYLSTLRRFVEAAGGTLELRVELPGSGVMRLTGMGELNAHAA